LVVNLGYEAFGEMAVGVVKGGGSDVGEGGSYLLYKGMWGGV